MAIRARCAGIHALCTIELAVNSYRQRKSYLHGRQLAAHCCELIEQERAFSKAFGVLATAYKSQGEIECSAPEFGDELDLGPLCQVRQHRLGVGVQRLAVRRAADTLAGALKERHAEVKLQ